MADKRRHKANSGRHGEHGLVQRIRKSFEGLSPRPGCLLVGYSAGADSLALLVLLTELVKTTGVQIHAIHVDHGVREVSAHDAAIASRVCGALGVPITMCSIPDGAIAGHMEVGREESMRRERYRAFAEVASQHAGAVLALAHHQRDQAETVLLHLLRGAGLRGAAGMRELSSIQVPWWDEPSTGDFLRQLTVWRPLLGERAVDVRAFAESSGLPIAADASNSDESYRRNAVRHSVLPVLEDIAPGATGNLSRFALLAGEDSDFLDSWARAELERQGHPMRIDRAWLLSLALPVRRRVLQFWIGRQVPAGLEVSLNRLDEVLKVAWSAGPERSVELGLGWSVRVSRRDLAVLSPSG